MGYLNRAGPQGFVTEDMGPRAPTTFVLEQHKGHTEPNVLYVTNEGVVEVNGGGAGMQLTGSLSGSFTGQLTGLAGSVRYEFHSHTGSQVVPIDPLFEVLQISDNVETLHKGLNLWDTATNTFRPTTLGEVYTLRLTGETGPTDGSGNQILHIDLTLSGTNMVSEELHSKARRHYQGTDVPMRSNQDDVDIFANFTVFVDADLIASGAQFFVQTTSNAGLQIHWCSLFIKEG